MRRPKVKLDHLIALITVAEKHNIDDAASEMGLSGSGVRKQLDAIEEAFGVRLFEKIGGRLVLTEDGELFRENAVKAVGQALLAEEQVCARQAIRKLMRHAQVSTTMKYGNAYMTEKRKAHGAVVQMVLPGTNEKAEARGASA